MRYYLLVEFPFPVVQRADLPSLEPPWYAVEVKGVVAHAPGNRALLAGGWGLIGLTLYAYKITGFKIKLRAQKSSLIATLIRFVVY